MNHSPKMTGTKVCTKCERELSVYCFSVNKKHADGLECHCRDCISAKHKRDNAQRKINILNAAFGPFGILDK